MILSRSVVAGVAALLSFSPSANAQSADLSAYYLHVGSGVTDGPFNESALTSFQRLRVMTSPAWGPLTFDVAYEHTLDVRSRERLSAPSLGLGAPGAIGDWLELQGTIHSGDHVLWRHRVDRASLTAALGSSVELSIGRQPISWATTLLLTPADPFVPFAPEDPFREFRVGVDAARIRAFLGPFTDVDIVFRPADFSDGDETITALARLRTVAGGVEVGGWVGALHDAWAGSASLTATFGGAAARAEVVLREIEDQARLRLAIGLDRSFTIAERDLYIVLEYQRDDLGAAAADEIPTVLSSDPARRGELLVLGRDALALQAAYSLHPLWTVDLLALTNLNDPSVLLGPAASYSLGAETSLRMGIFTGLGEGSTEAGLPASEHGPIPFLGYASFTLFF